VTYVAPALIEKRAPSGKTRGATQLAINLDRTEPT
jgi:hypothetical protein